MIAFIVENIGTIVISLLLAAFLIAVAVKLYRDKKQGKSCCGGNCESCASCPCHKK